jgi:hypothetical protein
MFLGSVRKLRNIRWVFMFLGPAEEHKRPICESRSFFCSSPLPPLFCAPLPAPHAPAPRLPAPHALATPGSPLPTRRPPSLPRPSAGRPAPFGRVHRPRLASPPFTDAQPSEPLRHLVPTPTQPCPTACSSRWPRLTQQRVPAAWPLSASATPCPTACADRPA